MGSWIQGIQIVLLGVFVFLDASRPITLHSDRPFRCLILCNIFLYKFSIGVGWREMFSTTQNSNKNFLLVFSSGLGNRYATRTRDLVLPGLNSGDDESA